MKRRTFLTTTSAALASLPWLPGCGGGGGSSAGATPAAPDPALVHVATLSVDAAAAGSAVNRRVLGSNVQWIDRGDNLLDAGGGFNPTMLGLAKALAPTVIRYPGGFLSETFHFDQASNENAYEGSTEITQMSVQRVLELCEATGAEPLFTVNVVTGSADEAARWVRLVNITRLTSSATGRLLPTVAFWEIGNEPYLKVDSRPDLDLSPAEFASRANDYIRAMRAVDPSISIGLPLSLDTRNGLPITAYPDFASSVLGAVTEPFDLACVHNAYLPLVFDGTPSTAALTLATLAAAESVRDDLADTRALLDQLRPGQAIPIAVTEHAPLFSLDPTASIYNWSSTPLGALYLADLLRVFAGTADLQLANHWSLSGNGRFGALGGNDASGAAGFNRAAADVLLLAGRALRGNVLAATIACDTVATPAIGLVAARSALPLLSALVTRDGSTLRALLIHKDSQRSAQVGINLSGASAASASLSTLSAADLTAASDVPGLWQSATSAPAGGRALTLTLPPHSVALLELGL